MPSSLTTRTVTVGTSAVLLTTDPTGAGDGSAPRRRLVRVQNLGAATIFVGGSNAVTTGTGYQVPATGGTFELTGEPGGEQSQAANRGLWAISGSAGNDVRVLEYLA